MAKSKAKKVRILQGDTIDEPLSMTLGSALGMAGKPGEADGEKPHVEEPVLSAATEKSDAKPRITKAVLQRARSGGGRWVVRVLLTPAQSKQELEALSRELRRAIGTGTRIEDNILVVQGDIPDRVESWFKARGVNKRVYS